MKKLMFLLISLSFFLIACVKDDDNNDLPPTDGPAPTTYCTPPGFKSGPYTGITKVKLEDLLNETASDVGYFFYENLTRPTLVRGKSYSIAINTTSYNPYGGLNTMVYIDWNRDGDFEDTDETAVTLDNFAPGVLVEEFSVPADASLGYTRMHIYEDMVEGEGHISPNPCGYLNNPNHSLGQHGETEDYIILISK